MVNIRNIVGKAELEDEEEERKGRIGGGGGEGGGEGGEEEEEERTYFKTHDARFINMQEEKLK